MNYPIDTLFQFPAEMFNFSDGRITTESKQFYQRVGVVGGVLVIAQDGDVVAGVTAVALSIASWRYAITIVRPEYRNKGIGTELVRRRLEKQKELLPDVRCVATIASDNFPSMRMALKVGYSIDGSRKPSRQDGMFLLLEMGQ
jgi:RimJ/RimL family protein N-acetyltransferase